MTRLIFIVILLFVIISMGALGVYFLVNSHQSSGINSVKYAQLPTSTVAHADTQVFSSNEKAKIQSHIQDSRYNAIVHAIEKVSSSIVNISSIHVDYIDPWFEFFRVPFGMPQRREYRGLGSGIIFDKAGHILTNQHVVQNADFIKVVLGNGQEFEAELVGEDTLSDIAVLKIDVENPPVVEFGDSDDLLIGEWAIAIGNPFAATVKDPNPTVTVGVISATHRALQSKERIYRNMIQTDASINPGNSGGALVNSLGQVIGVNTAIYSTSGGSQGIGFAIPINTAKKVMEKLLEHGIIIEPLVGLEYQELNEEILQHLKLTDVTGLIVTTVKKNSPAQQAGIQRTDIVEAIDGQPVHTIEDATAINRLFKTGQTVALDIIRDGNRKRVKILIEQLLDNFTIWGITVQPLIPKRAQQYQNKGVIVTDVKRKSPLRKVGLRVNDLIYAIGDYRINSLSNFTTIARRIPRKRWVYIYFERNGKEYRIRIALN